jgi:hypothetical protein
MRTNSAWINVDSALPMIERDGWSANVLVTDGTSQWIAYLQWFGDDDWPPIWKQQGPDGYTLVAITHWRRLPELPAV